MKSVLLALGAALLWAALPGSSASASPLRPLGLPDVLNMRRIAQYAPIAPSPDGRLAAYVVNRPSDVVQGGGIYTRTGASRVYANTTIWLVETATGANRNLSGDAGANWAATWSPDGRRLAFFSDRDGTAGLWIWEREADRLHRVGAIVPRGPLGVSLEWSPDGRRLLFSVLPEGAPLLAAISPESDSGDRVAPGTVPGSTVQLFRSEGSDGGGAVIQSFASETFPGDLALVDAVTGEVDRIARNVALMKASFSPDGQHIAYSELTGENVPGRHVYQYALHLFSLATRRVQTLVAPAEIGHSGRDFSWSPDSAQLAYRLGDSAGAVHLVSREGGSRAISSAALPPFTGIPAWDVDGRRLLLLARDAVWSVAVADGQARELARFPGKTTRILVPTNAYGDRPWFRDEGRSIVAVAANGIRQELHRVWLDGGQELIREETREFSGNLRFSVVGSPSTGRLLYFAEDAQHPEDLWISDGALRTTSRLTNLNPQISAVPMGALRIVEWTGNDGSRYSGALVLPSNYQAGRRYPLVVHVYPRNVLLEANRFGSTNASNEHLNLQLFATRGYAVFYSSATLWPADHEPMRSVANAVLPGIDHIIALGIADPDRIGIFGASAGGYSTLALLTQSNRFKVAMAQAAPGNLISLYGDLRASGYSHGLALNENTFRMPDHPWADRDRYIRNSPWFFLDRVRTPLLLIQGTNDTATNVNQANEIFLGMRRLGRTVQYARYVGEGHGLSSLQNRLDAGQRFLEWFDHYLMRDRPEARPVRRLR